MTRFIYYYFFVLDGFNDEEPIIVRVKDIYYKSACIRLISSTRIFDQITYIGCHFIDDTHFDACALFEDLTDIPKFDESIDHVLL